MFVCAVCCGGAPLSLDRRGDGGSMAGQQSSMRGIMAVLKPLTY